MVVGWLPNGGHEDRLEFIDSFENPGRREPIKPDDTISLPPKPSPAKCRA